MKVCITAKKRLDCWPENQSGNVITSARWWVLLCGIVSAINLQFLIYDIVPFKYRLTFDNRKSEIPACYE
jgi:hypothetical protein